MVNNINSSTSLTQVLLSFKFATSSLLLDMAFVCVCTVIVQISLEAMKSSVDEVALQGIEFWSTVCDEEVDLAIEAAEVHLRFHTLKSLVESCRDYFLNSNLVISLWQLLTECTDNTMISL